MKSPVKNPAYWQGPIIYANPNEHFLSAIAQAGLPVPPHIEADGRLHRYRDPDAKSSNKNCWYVLYSDGVAAGAYGDWRSGRSHTWSAKSPNTMSASERAEYRRRMAETRHQRQQEEFHKHQFAATKAKEIWARSASADPKHPYLSKKGVTAGIARQSGDALVLPIVAIPTQKIRSLQFIEPDGSKRMLSGGEKKGHGIPCSAPMTNLSRIIVCEGWATGRTLAMLDPTARVIAAIDAGNLESVAVNCRHQWPDIPLVIACDDDRLTDGNPGMTRGQIAAITSGASLIKPKWPVGAPNDLTDFNDLQLWHVRQGGAA
ncbi:MAG: hypothetical protein B7X12_00650 [Halothiobacillus sp. 20-53-49]|jgi:putative DNA primase/helicase|uniref:toprim domain-containing protein n=1 Tax=Halothiobacillus sp. 15-55-196 TaxID=1970382 RepID=UPI000BDAFE8E|nr:toprim domain-containing protein [Halothiobacillus sp. 15-55-196]OYV47432.1 MAG: hypothetical protein B7X12_00650 [Halothiobacillus sp. 20-53-49]OZB37290.1 MAG: hypothetical protein B7X44_02590 [Halothiobacillus sp. 15-55-196]HUM99186.1 toprim domain-containing protein [Halothiobacillus sp.]